MMNQSVSRDVWVFIEQEEGVIAEVSLELLAKGRELAQGTFATPGQSGAMALGIKNLVNKLPALSQVEDWVAQAKKLPRAVSY